MGDEGLRTFLHRIGIGDKAQIAILVGISCIGAFVLQNFEGWHAKNTLATVEPEIVEGTVTSINLLPSNTSTSYSVSVAMANGEKATLIASLKRARNCSVGQTIRIEKRGLDHRFTSDGCDNG